MVTLDPCNTQDTFWILEQCGERGRQIFSFILFVTSITCAKFYGRYTFPFLHIFIPCQINGAWLVQKEKILMTMIKGDKKVVRCLSQYKGELFEFIYKYVEHLIRLFKS